MVRMVLLAAFFFCGQTAAVAQSAFISRMSAASDYTLNGQLVRADSMMNELEAWLKQADPLPDDRDLALFYQSYGMLKTRMSQAGNAIGLLKRSLSLQPQITLPDSFACALTRLALAQAYLETEDIDEAVRLLEKNMHVVESFSLPDLNFSILLANVTAFAYIRNGDLYKAVQTIDKVLNDPAIVSASEQQLSQLYYAQADLFSRLGNFQQASIFADKALWATNAGGIPYGPDRAARISQLANLYLSDGNYRVSDSLYRIALSMFRSMYGTMHPTYASALIPVTHSLIRQQNFKAARDNYRQVAAIFRNTLGEKHRDYVMMLNQIGEFYLSLGNADTALAKFREASELASEIFPNRHPDYEYIQTNLAASLGYLSRTGEAARVLRSSLSSGREFLTTNASSLSEEQKKKFLGARLQTFSLALSFLQDNPNLQAILGDEVFTTAVLINNFSLISQSRLLHEVRQKGDTQLYNLYLQWQADRTVLSQQYLLPAKDRKVNTDSLQNRTEYLERLLSALLGNAGEVSPPIPEHIAAALRPDETALQFVKYRYFNKGWTNKMMYGAFIVKANKEPLYVPLFEEKQLAGILKYTPEINDPEAYVNYLYPPAKQQIDSVYHLVWRPLEKYVEGSRTIFISRAGLLHRVAFAALKDSLGTYNVEKFLIRDLLSFSPATLRAKPPALPRSAAIWGAINYASGNVPITTKQPGAQQGQQSFGGSFLNAWSPLKDAALELDSLARWLTAHGVRVKSATGSGASEQAFKQFEKNSPELLHLSTHGFFLPYQASAWEEPLYGPFHNTFQTQQNPMLRSGLILAGANYAWNGYPVAPGTEDGILTAYEISQMDLHRTRFAVLSACETGLGDLFLNEGVIGLQRALKMSGIRKIMISLWKVPATGTQQLMSLFYRNWLEGMNMEDALRSAQLVMQKNYSPYYWAGFQIVE